MSGKRWTSPCGRATLWLGDCRELLDLAALGPGSAIVTDPPYGIAHSTHGQLFRGAEPIAGDDSTLAYTWLDKSKLPIVAFYSPYCVPPIEWRSVLCWWKGGDTGIGGDRRTCWKRDIEMIGIKNNSRLLGKRDSALLSFRSRADANYGHFCQKPVALMSYLIGKISEGTIVDPFMGSGTTGVSAIRHGRTFYGVEVDSGHFSVAKSRIESALQESPLWDRGVASQLNFLDGGH